MSLVSIVTPAFNAAKTLAQTIDSVRAQTFQDWEIIIVDDASDDSTTALAAHYALEDKRVRIIRRAENGGIAKARNQGLSAATGRYIAFLDSNDLWLPEKLALQLNFMEENNATISCTAYRRFSSLQNPGAILRAPKRITFDTLLRAPNIGMLTAVIDRDNSGPFYFNEQIGGDEDLALWLTITKAGQDVLFFDRDLARHRVALHLDPREWIHIGWTTWRIYRDIAGLPKKQAAKALAFYFLYSLRKRMF
ncbi:MAG: glycosyl transferase [Alphaproteobacteria bacterium]|nr:glycosyl transferase [Alphaproteobacteria bacterium]